MKAVVVYGVVSSHNIRINRSPGSHSCGFLFTSQIICSSLDVVLSTQYFFHSTRFKLVHEDTENGSLKVLADLKIFTNVTGFECET